MLISYGQNVNLLSRGICNLLIAVASYFLIQETQGLSLEEINAKFDGTEALLQTKISNETGASFESTTANKERSRVKEANVAWLNMDVWRIEYRFIRDKQAIVP